MFNPNYELKDSVFNIKIDEDETKPKAEITFNLADF